MVDWDIKNQIKQTLHPSSLTSLHDVSMFITSSKDQLLYILQVLPHVLHCLFLYVPLLYMEGTKIFKYCTCPVGRVTYNFHSSCKHMHMSFKSISNKEHKCNTTSSSNSFESTLPVHSSYRTSALGRIACSFLISLLITQGLVSGIFVP